MFLVSLPVRQTRSADVRSMMKSWPFHVCEAWSLIARQYRTFLRVPGGEHEAHLTVRLHFDGCKLFITQVILSSRAVCPVRQHRHSSAFHWTLVRELAEFTLASCGMISTGPSGPREVPLSYYKNHKDTILSAVTTTDGMDQTSECDSNFGKCPKANIFVEDPPARFRRLPVPSTLLAMDHCASMIETN